ncbi:MAG TPA: YigZ family protein [Nocardioidaceae bacterium]
MTGPTSYLTVAGPAEAEIVVKRSRFLCRIEPVATEEAARAVVEEERRRHWDARHHCSAFVLGPAGEVQRSSDDGEPSGTAGAPMLEVLRGRGVSDVVAVVTRWFGGVLLGAGGLVRAYSDAVRAGLDEAGALERRLVDLYDVAVAHADAGRLENGLRARDVAVLGVEYGERAVLRVAVPTDEAARLPGLLAELSGGDVEPAATGQAWVDAPRG